LAASASALANPQVMFNSQPWGSTIGGGPFNFTGNAEFSAGNLGVPVPSTPVAANQFLTFCVEDNEFISFGATYNVAFNTAAVNGGVGGGNPDPLDPRTACLYTRFMDGSLSSVSGFTYGATASGDALQQAIWYIEEEIPSLPAGLSTTLYNSAVSAGWTDIGSVRVLNLTDSNGGPSQDVLVMVPLPSGIALATVGLAGLTFVRRRR
jgi:hypothetical protein